MDTFEQVQSMALASHPELTGDQLDRIGNLVCDQVSPIDQVTDSMLDRAVHRVQTHMMIV